MSEQQQGIIAELLNRIEESKQTSDMSWSTAKDLTSLVRMLQVA